MRKTCAHSKAQIEYKLIEKHANQWCKDNGYPIQRRKYVYRGKWVKNEVG